MSLLMVSGMNLCCMDNLGFSETPRPTASSFHWTLPIKSLPSPHSVFTSPPPLFLICTHMHTSCFSSVFCAILIHFPGMQPDLGSIHLFIGHLQLPRNHDPNLFDFNWQIFSLCGLNCTLIRGRLCRHTQIALLRCKAFSCTSVMHLLWTEKGVFGQRKKKKKTCSAGVKQTIWAIST